MSALSCRAWPAAGAGVGAGAARCGGACPALVPGGRPKGPSENSVGARRALVRSDTGRSPRCPRRSARSPGLSLCTVEYPTCTPSTREHTGRRCTHTRLAARAHAVPTHATARPRMGGWMGRCAINRCRSDEFAGDLPDGDLCARAPVSVCVRLRASEWCGPLRACAMRARVQASCS
jgi:hypothetical protein